MRTLALGLCLSMLMGCEDWNRLACARGACPDGGIADGGTADGGREQDAGDADSGTLVPDAGPFEIQGSVDDDAGEALVGFALGLSSQIIATPRVVHRFSDGGVTSSPKRGGANWRLLAVSHDNLPRFWIVDADSQLFLWDEARTPIDVVFTGTGPLNTSTLVPYVETDRAEVVALFGSDGTTTNVSGFAANSSLASDSQPCGLSGLRSASLVGRTMSLVTGLTSNCILADAGIARNAAVATRWPRGAANPPPLVLSADGGTRSVRVSSNNNAATAVIDQGGTIEVVSIDDSTTEAAPQLSLQLTVNGLPVSQGLLDEVQQSGDPDQFVYAVTNRTSQTVSALPEGLPSIALPPSATLLVLAQWNSGRTSVVGTQLLAPSRSFTSLRFAMDVHQNELWLAVSCPGATPNKSGDRFCSTATRHTLLRWIPRPM